MKTWFFLFLSITFFISCNHSHGHSDDPLYKEVMAVHDSIMPEMSTIHRYKKQLKKARESNPGVDKTIMETLSLLEKADDGMMDWMAQFRVPSEIAKQKEYLQTQKEKIQKVSDDMTNAMDVAKKLIDSLNVK